MLDHGKGVNNGQNSNISYENEIHSVDSPTNENSKIYFFSQGGPNLGGRTARKFRGVIKNIEIHCYTN